MHAFALLRHEYALLHSGGAMGRGCGPLVVAPKTSSLSAVQDMDRVSSLADGLERARVAIPGELTTAGLLAESFAGGLKRPIVMPFDRMMPAVAGGEVDAGVIIHEGRFTYGSYGLRALVDLGEWWEHVTGLPLPLGGIAVRRALEPELKARIDATVRESVAYGRAHPDETAQYVRAHSQEMDPLVCAQHIELYVNDFSLDYGGEGEAAIRRLLETAEGLSAGGARDAGRRGDQGERPGVFWDE
jgi:1,4-dihydroxy-6-naphthoate synthase